MDEAKVRHAAEVAREEAMQGAEHAYATVFSRVFDALIYEPTFTDNRTATAAEIDEPRQEGDTKR